MVALTIDGRKITVPERTTILEAARWLVYRLGYLAETLKDLRIFAKEAALTKSFVAEAAVDVSRLAMAVHGSYGLMDDYGVSAGEKRMRGAGKQLVKFSIGKGSGLSVKRVIPCTRGSSEAQDRTDRLCQLHSYLHRIEEWIRLFGVSIRAGCALGAKYLAGQGRD